MIIWTIADASENSSQSGTLWVAVVMLSGVFGVLIYYLAGRDETDETDRNGRRDRKRNGGWRKESPSHVCQSCNEKYYTDASTDIRLCRNCGGYKIEGIPQE